MSTVAAMATAEAPVSEPPAIIVEGLTTSIRLSTEGFIDADYFTGLLNEQIAGRVGASFQLWTVMNAVLWHASWIEGREDCL